MRRTPASSPATTPRRWRSLTGNRTWPIISLVGGKWTTFRGFAEEVADTVLSRLQKTRRVSTRELPIGGGRDFPTDDAARKRWIEQVSAQTGASPERAKTLLERYGSTGRQVLEHEAAFGPESLPDAPGYSAAEFDWIARNDSVVHLEDLVMRRTAVAVTGQLSARGLDRIATIAAAALGWSDDRREAELQGARDLASQSATGFVSRPEK